MRTLYQPPRPEKQHECLVEWWRDYNHADRYKVVECETCGQRWLLVGRALAGGSAWHKVRWWSRFIYHLPEEAK